MQYIWQLRREWNATWTSIFRRFICQRVRNRHSSFRVTKQHHGEEKCFLQRKAHTKVLVLLQLTRLHLQLFGVFYWRLLCWKNLGNFTLPQGASSRNSYMERSSRNIFQNIIRQSCIDYMAVSVGHFVHS